MTPPTRHYEQEIQDFLDGRLAEPERTRLAEHLAGCAQCRAELEALKWLKLEVLGQLPRDAVPPALTARVRAGLDAEAAGAGAQRDGLRRASFRPFRWAAAAVLAAAAFLVLLFVWRPASPDLPERVARDFAEFTAGRLPLRIEAREPRAIEEFFAQNGVPFATRVFDLAMMRYELLGGRVHRLGGHQSAFFVYRGADGRLLICQMYQGSLTELPPADEIREHNGITFQVHRRGGTTVVFWQEGDLVCVLVSDGPSESVIDLAFAKAVKV
ncbi:MAG TPA: zf-HC2 domain-containing protein [Gemmatimonadales bacterium]|nr:zf-HC2 domain-containing protein [Gemmatimonadales bacterium]